MGVVTATRKSCCINFNGVSTGMKLHTQFIKYAIFVRFCSAHKRKKKRNIFTNFVFVKLLCYITGFNLGKEEVKKDVKSMLLL